MKLHEMESVLWGVSLGEFAHPEKALQRAFFGDGTYIRRTNPIGTFTIKENDTLCPGLPPGPEEEFSFSLPKVPAILLRQMVSFYRSIMERMNGAEAFCFISWDKEKKRYILRVPKQTVMSVHVSYETEKDLYSSERYVDVISAHSHNKMPAYFSGLDNKDEQADMLFLVLGRLDKEIPQARLRAAAAGKEVVTLPLDTIFNVTDADLQMARHWKGVHPPQWEDRVVRALEPERVHLQSTAKRNSVAKDQESLRDFIPDNNRIPFSLEIQDYMEAERLEDMETAEAVRDVAFKFLRDIRPGRVSDSISFLVRAFCEEGFAEVVETSFGRYEFEEYGVFNESWKE